jgi:hypothetical protein
MSHRASRSRASDAVESVLTGIGRKHVENESRRRTVQALHRAEVAVVGDPDGRLSARLAATLLRCAGTIVSEATPRTRFLVIGPSTSRRDLERLRTEAVAIVAERELGCMVDVYESVTKGTALRDASTRARKEAQEQRMLERSLRPPEPEEDARARRMARADDQAGQRSRSAAARRAAQLAENRLAALQDHARAARASGKTGPFRDHRLG